MKKKNKIIMLVLVFLVTVSIVIGVSINNSRYMTAEEAMSITFLSMSDGDGNAYFGPETTISIMEAGERGVIDYQLTKADVFLMSGSAFNDSESSWKQLKILKSDYIDWIEKEVTYTSADGQSQKMTRAEGLDKTNNTIRGQLLGTE